MNMKALATPASRRCSKSGAASRKKPHSPMNNVASTAPTSIKAPGGPRRSSSGVASAPSR